MNFVFVLDKDKKPLDPCHPAVARKLIKNNKASIFKRFPFTIILKRSIQSIPQPLHLKIDPGSKTTGLAIVKDNKVIWAAELSHRGFQIKSDLESRRNIRRSRRNRKTRYRKARFLNRTRPKGWLPPSLMSRVHNILTWVKRLIKYSNITTLFQELVKFDTQKLMNPEIKGVEYQQGTLEGYDVKQYLLEKWNYKCAYCQKEGVPLQVEHVVPKSKGGSNRVSNLCIACEPCNQRKGSKSIEEFLKNNNPLLQTIKQQLKTPLKDTAVVNATKHGLLNSLKELGLPVITGSGGRTKYNRTRFNLPKTHWIDASCVGIISGNLILKTVQPLLIKACGHGSRQMTRVNKFGFPCSKAKKKGYGGWKTGDIVKLITKKGEIIRGRLTVSNKPSEFEIKKEGKRIKANPNTNGLKRIYKRDGYNYSIGDKIIQI